MIGPLNQERRVIHYLGILAVLFCVPPARGSDRNIIHYVILPQPVQQIIFQQPTPPALVVQPHPTPIGMPPPIVAPTTPVYYPVTTQHHRPIFNWCRT